MRLKDRLSVLTATLLYAGVVLPASAAFVDPSVTPAGATAFANWNRNDTNSTYQQWRGTVNGGSPSLDGSGENFTTVFGLNQPDNDYHNPNGIATAQYLDNVRNSSGVTSAILISGTQNIYSFGASADWEVISPDYNLGDSYTTTAILQVEVLGNELLVGSTTPGNPSAPNIVKMGGLDWVDHVELSRVGAGGGGDAVTHWFRFELPGNAASHVLEFDTYDAALGAYDEGLYGHVSTSAIALDTFAAAITLQGDLDHDGFVGINDLNIVLGNWNQNVPPADPAADPSADGFVGIDDLNLVLGNWNNGTPPAVGAEVPEPATAGLFALSCLAMLHRR